MLVQTLQDHFSRKQAVIILLQKEIDNINPIDLQNKNLHDKLTELIEKCAWDEFPQSLVLKACVNANSLPPYILQSMIDDGELDELKRVVWTHNQLQIILHKILTTLELAYGEI